MVPMIPPIVIARRRLAHRFLAADAVRPDDGISLGPLNIFQRRVFDAWRAAQIVKPGRAGTWYLDLPAYEKDRQVRRERATILAGAAAVAGALIALTR